MKWQKYRPVILIENIRQMTLIYNIIATERIVCMCAMNCDHFHIMSHAVKIVYSNLTFSHYRSNQIERKV